MPDIFDPEDRFIFVSIDNVEVEVDWEIIKQSPILSAMVLTILNHDGHCDGPMYLHINGKLMEKIFTFCHNHRDDWDSYEVQLDPLINLTDEDYELFTPDDEGEFTQDDLTYLLEAAVDLCIYHLKNALVSFLQEQAELALSDDLSDLILDLDEDELTPEEEEEFLNYYSWIQQA